jgi:curved DNA-binding protein CbpA
MTERKPDAQGDLRRYPFPRLLYYLYKKQFLGELILSQPGTLTGHVYFRDGLPVFTDLPFAQDVLGRVLLERGLITEQDLYASLQEMATSQQRQGEILVGMGVLQVAGLIEGLRLQLARKLIRVFPVTDLSFAIYSGDHGRGMEGVEAQVRADPLWVIYQGVRNAFDETRMQPELEKLQGMLVRLPSSFEDIQLRYGMGDEMQGLITLLSRGSVSVERLYGVSDLGPVVTRMLVYTLWVTEVLEAAPAGARQPRPPSAPMPRVPTGEVAPVQAAPSAPMPRVPTGEVAPVQAAPQAPPQAAPQAPPQAQRPVYQTAPEVAALAQSFSDAVGQADPSAPKEDGTPIITSAPSRGISDGAAGPELGQEGVYAIPANRGAQPGPQQAAPDPLSQVPSSPGLSQVPSSPGLSQVPSSPGLKRVPSSLTSQGIDAGAAARHHQLIRKTHKRLTEENFYQLLGVAPTATNEQIREAYFSLAKDFHPDRVTAYGLTDISKEAEEIFRAINEAHSTLTNAEARANYDEELKTGGKKQAAHDALAAEFAFQKGLVHFRKKNFPEALRHFQEAYKLNPEEGEHLAYVAWALYSDPKSNRKSLLPKVKEQLLKAIRISPNSATCHYFLGEIYLAMDEERRAFTCFDKVLEIKPDHLEAQRHIRIIRMRREKQKDQKKGLLDRLRKK